MNFTFWSRMFVLPSSFDLDPPVPFALVGPSIETGTPSGGRMVEDRVELRLAVDRLRETDVVQGEVAARRLAERPSVEQDHGRDREGEPHDVLVLGEVADRHAVHDGAVEGVASCRRA